jgi:hypothetical protein
MYALVSMWSKPEQQLLGQLHGTLYVCSYMGTGGLHVIDIESIVSVVALTPIKLSDEDKSAWFLVVEKPGLDALIIGEGDDADTEVCGQES